MWYRIQALVLTVVISLASAGANAFAVGSISFRLVPGPQVTLDISGLVGQSEEDTVESTQATDSENETTLAPPVLLTPIGEIDGSSSSKEVGSTTDLLPPIDVPELVEEIVDPEDEDLENVPPTGSKDGKTDTNPDNDDWWLKVPLPNTLLLLILGLGVLLRGAPRGKVRT